MKPGIATDSQDADGKALEEKSVPNLTREHLEAALKKYTGDFYQIPPMVSALKQGGVPLYKLARAGKTVEREPRLVHIGSYVIDDVALPLIKFRIQCSKGFYVRTYCHHIANYLPPPPPPLPRSPAPAPPIIKKQSVLPSLSRDQTRTPPSPTTNAQRSVSLPSPSSSLCSPPCEPSPPQFSNLENLEIWSFPSPNP